MNLPLNAQIESVLFWKGEPLSKKKLADILKKSIEEIETALTELDTNLQNRGLSLVHRDDEVMLGTSSDMSSLIETLTKEELIRDLGKAGTETLSIILYRGPVSRAEIDYIRGVNSNFIVRNLLVRGLIEKTSNPNDQRSFLYKPTFELLTHLGVTKIEDLPEYDSVRAEISTFEQNQKDEPSTQTHNDISHDIQN